MKRLNSQAIILGLISVLFAANVAAQTLEQRVERLERMSNNPVLLQHAQRMNDQQREIQTLYDQVDRLNRKIEQLEAKLNTQFSDTDQRLSKLESQAKELSRPAAIATEPGLVVIEDNQQAPELGVDSSQAKQRYDEAFGLLRDAKYDDAINAFNAFVKDFPKSDLSSNAYYWLGEAFLIKQDYQQAFDSFNKVIVDFAKSNKVDDSLLRGADSLVGLNRLDEAKKMYQDLIERSPESRAAKSAQRRLERFKTGE